MLLAGADCLDWTHVGASQVRMTEDLMGVSVWISTRINLTRSFTESHTLVRLVESG